MCEKKVKKNLSAIFQQYLMKSLDKMRKFVEKIVGINNLIKIWEEDQFFYLINAWRSDIGEF